MFWLSKTTPISTPPHSSLQSDIAIGSVLSIDKTSTFFGLSHLKSNPYKSKQGDPGDKKSINYQSNDYQDIQGDNLAVCKALSCGSKEPKISITSQKS